jgi:hypothetical protein
MYYHTLSPRLRCDFRTGRSCREYKGIMMTHVYQFNISIRASFFTMIMQVATNTLSLMLRIFLLLLLSHGVSTGMIAASRPWNPRQRSIKPILSSSDLHDRSWSNQSATMARNGRVYSYDNYTVELVGERNTVRWTKRELASSQEMVKRSLLLGFDY